MPAAKSPRRRQLKRYSAPVATVKSRKVGRGVPVNQANLTAGERALLPDPERVTQDDADAIICMRRERTEKAIPLEKVLKRYGYRVEG